MKIYVAGPMRGHDKFNFPAFDAACTMARKLGHDPISPAEMDRDMGFDENQSVIQYKFNLKAAIIRDTIAVAGCDAIALLPGWEKSSGATVELALAQFLGLKILCADTFESMPTAHVGAL